MKTPEEQAEEFTKTLEQVPIMYYLPTEPCRQAFLAGYQAAKDEQAAQEREAQEQMRDAIQRMRDKVAAHWMSGGEK